ncbi:hypothetical protein PVAND_017052 [Polypedilum vanderplanki]|uniref:Uncharacterized protein n=1 Tax=Polypedilum vanderplanki TaxID=319348 RepID=A0A9J6BH62_POLVA|nr:hypothetical protein PVAND_017052 [Polypedilum vanderplanki]
MQIKLLIVLLINLLILNFVSCDEGVRKLEAYKNPKCNDTETVKCDNFAFVHIVAESELDTIHYLWNFQGKISTLIAKTSKNSTLNINWEKFDGISKSVNFSIKPDYIYSSVINSFFLFNDTLDKGNISDTSVVDIIRFDTQNLTWTLTNITENAGNNKVTAEVHTATSNNGSFTIMFTAYGMEKHSDELPHLYHSSDSMQVDLIASKIKTNFTNPRIAIEILTLTKEDVKEGDSKINRIRNLDDEFTPGIFDVYHVLSPRSINNTKGGFIEFRPVCYNSPNRTVSSSTELSFSNPKNFDDETEEFKNSLPYMYFHNSTLTHKLKESINITFGMPNDGFYSRTNYISFSYLIGLGAPLKEGLSLFVIIFASIGLGVPLLVLLVGGSYVAVKRYKN